jgi:hypothetical protein
MALRKLTRRTGFRTGAAYRWLLGANAKKDYDESAFRFSFCMIFPKTGIHFSGSCSNRRAKCEPAKLQK